MTATHQLFAYEDFHHNRPAAYPRAYEYTDFANDGDGRLAPASVDPSHPHAETARTPASALLVVSHEVASAPDQATRGEHLRPPLRWEKGRSELRQAHERRARRTAALRLIGTVVERP